MIKTGKNVKKTLNWTLNRKIFVVCTVMVPILHFFVFYLYLNLNSFLLAFQMPKTYTWTLSNFAEFWDKLTSPNGEILIACKNTAKYFLLNIVMLFANLVVAYFLYKKIWCAKIFRVIFYLPGIISSVAMSTVFMEFIKPQGPLGEILRLFGVTMRDEGLLANPETATDTIMSYCVWTGFSGTMLLFSSSLARIPSEVIEASRLDGCGVFRELVSIILPLIVPMFTTLLITTIAGIFNAGGPVLLFTMGKFDTTTIPFWIFQQVYGSGSYGGSGFYGLVSAAGLCFTAVAVPLVMITRKLMEKIPAVEY